jgi:hypothetical protein
MIFNPRTGHWFSADQMRLARAFPAAILLQDGSVLVAGGNAGVDGTATAEIYPANQSPVAYAPVQSLRVSTIDQTAVPVTIGWRVAGDSDPIDAYQLQQRTNGGTFVTVPLDSATSTSRMRKLNPGSSHRFRVRATDARGATSSFSLGPPKTLVAVQDGETIEIAYEGAWTTSTIPNFFGNTARVSTTAGSTATLKFTGTNVGWVTRRSPTSGKAEVYLDGVRVATIDLYSPTPRFRQMVFVRNGLASATHTLEIRVLGTKSAASGGTRIDIDAYVVLQ